MPRILLIVDEFQEFFVEDDKISQDAALLLDRLVRQGRAFGIHVLLGSQTLAGAYSLARSTIGQMAVRIALQCSEADAHLILSEDNSAARLLSRPGEAIYNDSNGLVEGNHPFQVVWLPDERREVYLEQVQSLVEQRDGYAARPQVVFEGNVPADPDRNKPLARAAGRRPARRALRTRPAPGWARPWRSRIRRCGQFRRAERQQPADRRSERRGGAGHDDDGAGQPVGPASGVADSARARFYVFDGSAAGSTAGAALASLATLTLRPGARGRLATSCRRPSASWRPRSPAGRPRPTPSFRRSTCFVYGLQKLARPAPPEDDFSFSRGSETAAARPGQAVCRNCSRDGPALGVFTLVWCDSVNNLNRTWDRQTLREFEMRVAFQMSANDSSTLIDTPVASRLGANRALFHSEEQDAWKSSAPIGGPAPPGWRMFAGSFTPRPSRTTPVAKRLTV